MRTHGAMAARVDVEEMRRNGYLIARGVFSPAEIRHFRESLNRVQERVRDKSDFDSDIRYPALMMLRGDILSHHELEPVDFVVLDERIVDLARQLLGPQIVYHGDSTAQIGEGPRGFH